MNSNRDGLHGARLGGSAGSAHASDGTRAGGAAVLARPGRSGVTGATGALPAASSGASVPLPFKAIPPRPAQGHPDRPRPLLWRGAASTAPGFAGASSASFAPPTSSATAPLGILTEDLQRLNSYFQLSDQRKFAASSSAWVC